ncbi:MAG: glycosyltransferase [Flavobacteriaceae bacterium]|jgi:hypothetical protein|nr:glycosyltransferase [Flavobacteriaceae bacterium]
MADRKILIISYYWSPAGGPGVQRWLKFTQYLPDFGFEPYVYVPENPSYPIIDQSLEKEVSPKVKVIKRPIWEPYKIAEKLTKKNKDFKAGQFETQKKKGFLSNISIFIRGNFFIPDARKFWIKPSVKFLNRYLKENQIDILVTTAPPHSMHLIGLKLKQLNPNLKWIADFRDPWTQISYYSQLKLTLLADRKHRKLEKEVMQTSDLVISTSYTDKENFEKIGAKKVVCITNGFDSEINTQKTETKKFTLSYIGMLETLRNPQNLWSALNELLIENKYFEENFQLKFVGKIADSLLEDLKNSPLKNHILNKGYLSHHQSLEEMNHSDILLITNFPQEKSRGIIPGKLFEYLASGRIVLSVGAENSDVEKILRQTQAGKHFLYSDKDEIKSFILSEFEKWTNHMQPSVSPQLQQFHRKELTRKLVEEIKKL